MHFGNILNGNSVKEIAGKSDIRRMPTEFQEYSQQQSIKMFKNVFYKMADKIRKYIPE